MKQDGDSGESANILIEVDGKNQPQQSTLSDPPEALRKMKTRNMF